MSVNSPIRFYDDANIIHFSYSFIENPHKLNMIIQLTSYEVTTWRVQNHETDQDCPVGPARRAPDVPQPQVQ